VAFGCWTVDGLRGKRGWLATALKTSHSLSVANIIAFLVGIIALVLAIVGFIPLLGWLNWLIICIAGVGAAFGFISEKNSGRNFCFVVMAICAFRLWIGGGII
jgi:hypothetical protein